ncbi:hypothetical protein ACFXOK_15730 [Streptomyces sp. NPDC059173]|uniref:hypothetical protein n=1 Tax=Streptomyces sp. NPDC059173 TaxID=3346756 RepID=UPI003694C78E
MIIFISKTTTAQADWKMTVQLRGKQYLVAGAATAAVAGVATASGVTPRALTLDPGHTRHWILRI